jgi:prevent-host-death family protein
MRTAAVSELKARLSDYLKHVKAGEEVIVTERGKAIARVVPFTRSGPTPAEREEMIRAGLLIPAKRKGLPPDFWDRPRAQDPEGSVLKALLQEREEGW